MSFQENADGGFARVTMERGKRVSAFLVNRRRWCGWAGGEAVGRS